MTKPRLRTFLPEEAKKWLREGYSVGVYENVDLSSQDVGRRVWLRVGKDSTLKEAPNRLPDTRSFVGWRYRKIGVLKKDKLKKVS